MSWWERFLDRRAKVKTHYEIFIETISRRWGATFYDLGLVAPQIQSIEMLPYPYITIKVEGLQPSSDLEEIAGRIAYGLGIHSVRFEDIARYHIRVYLEFVDPLSMVVELPEPVTSVSERLLLGRVQSGQLLLTTLPDQVHIIVQGQSRSGKSRWVYGFLAQLAQARDIIVAGVDPSRILLRPWENTRHASWQSLGSDVESHLALLQRLVAEMERRLTAMPANLDVLPLSNENPLILVVLEEYPALIQMLTDYEASHAKSKMAAQFKALVSRLFAESAKVGMRVLLITQRAEAALISSFNRAQAPLRITFRVDDTESIQMLHPSVSKEAAEAHLTSTAARALVSGAGLPLVTMRSPEMPSYETYVDIISACHPTKELN
jgi:S-DNA-T family DNA segregation ATPase FtsK/SpoIIIE